MWTQLLRDLTSALDHDHVYVRPADLAAYSYDSFSASGERRSPIAVVFPRTAHEVAAVVTTCVAHGAPMVPRGAGTGYGGGAIGDGAVIISLTRMGRILGVEHEAARMHVEAGAVTATIHRRALSIGHCYAPDPTSASTCTIGGNIACNAGGPHSLRYGSTADHVAGVQAVLGDGRIVSVGEGTGGQDLLALLLGSEGTLGIVTSALLRLIPEPASRTTLTATLESMDQAVAAVAAIARAGVVPSALECLDRAAIDAIRPVTTVPVAADAGALLLIELEGDADRVNAEADAVHSACTACGARTVDRAHSADQATRLWTMRRAVSAAIARIQVGSVNHDLVIPRDRAAELVARAGELSTKHELPIVTFGHLGDGSLQASILCDPRIAGDRAHADAAAADLFDAVLTMGGAITGEHGVGTAKLAYVERQIGEGGLALMHRIKQTVDPAGLLNPGKKLPVAAAAVAAAV